MTNSTRTKSTLTKLKAPPFGHGESARLPDYLTPTCCPDYSALTVRFVLFASTGNPNATETFYYYGRPQ